MGRFEWEPAHSTCVVTLSEDQSETGFLTSYRGRYAIFASRFILTSPAAAAACSASFFRGTCADPIVTVKLHPELLFQHLESKSAGTGDGRAAAAAAAAAGPAAEYALCACEEDDLRHRGIRPLELWAFGALHRGLGARVDLSVYYYRFGGYQLEAHVGFEGIRGDTMLVDSDIGDGMHGAPILMEDTEGYEVVVAVGRQRKLGGGKFGSTREGILLSSLFEREDLMPFARVRDEHKERKLLEEVYDENAVMDDPEEVQLVVRCLREGVKEQVQRVLREVSGSKLRNFRTADNKSFLHLAAMYRNRTAMFHLLSLPCGSTRPNAADRMGNTPLHMAAYSGQDEMIYMLVDAGAFVDIQNQAGETPMHKAAMNGHGSTCIVLLRKGADATILDWKGRSAVRVARDLEKVEAEHAIAETMAHIQETLERNQKEERLRNTGRSRRRMAAQESSGGDEGKDDDRKPGERPKQVLATQLALETAAKRQQELTAIELARPGTASAQALDESAAVALAGALQNVELDSSNMRTSFTTFTNRRQSASREGRGSTGNAAVSEEEDHLQDQPRQRRGGDGWGIKRTETSLESAGYGTGRRGSGDGDEDDEINTALAPAGPTR